MVVGLRVRPSASDLSPPLHWGAGGYLFRMSFDPRPVADNPAYLEPAQHETPDPVALEHLTPDGRLRPFEQSTTGAAPG